MESDPIDLVILVVISTTTACMNWNQEDAKRLWAEQQDTSVFKKQNNIDDYLRSFNLLDKQEVKLGIVEYSFEEKREKWFTPSEAKCRFILVVKKDTGEIINWRYNGNPEYCTANP
jgi:hypothetical protein